MATKKAANDRAPLVGLSSSTMSIIPRSALEHAHYYVQRGISVIPIRADGSKQPVVKWKIYQLRLPTPDELRRQFNGGCGLAAVGGRISRCLELFDLDDAAVFDEFRELVQEHLGEDFWSRLLIVQTPKPGYHFPVRCPEALTTDPVRYPASQKLAMRPNPNYGKPRADVSWFTSDEPRWLTRIETKAEGGYFLLPGCPPACHPKNREYRVIQGDFDHIPVITADERQTLLDISRSFDLQPRQTFKPPVPKKPLEPGELLPGQDFELRGPGIERLLEDAGWRRCREFTDKIYWTRPGKERGVSASTNGQYLYVFTTNSQFDANRAYGKFAVYTILKFDRDFKVAAEVLYELGYGKRFEATPVDEEEIEATPADDVEIEARPRRERKIEAVPMEEDADDNE